MIDIWAMVCLAVGLILVAAEAFIPGFGAFGVIGFGLLAAAAILQAATVWQAVLYFVIALAVGALLFLWITRSFSRGRLSQSKVVLKEAADGTAAPSLEALVGQTGTAATKLRPAGKALISGVLYDVVSQGAFIEEEETIVVLSAEGSRVVVKRLS